MQLFYSVQIDGRTGQLSGQEAVHCQRVLRYRPGDMIHVLNGKGTVVKGLITTCLKNIVEFDIIDRDSSENLSAKMVHMAVSIPKNPHRFEWMVEKLVEIGTSRITPIICAHNEKKTIKKDRIVKIMISAMKQSNRRFLPRLDEPIPFTRFIGEVNAEGLWMAHYAPENEHLQNFPLVDGHSCVVVGPEGDFSADELKLAKDKGFQEVNISTARLRCETAAIVAATILNREYAL